MNLFYRFLNGLLFILPAYIANSSPTVVGGGSSIDNGKKAFDGRPLFGPHKTWLGLVGGILLGVATGALVYGLTYSFPHLPLELAVSLSACFFRAFLLSLGTHFGDLLGSFTKRRLNKKAGDSFPFFDQLGFYLFAILVSAPFYWFGWVNFFVWLIITIGVHPLFNFFAWVMGLQDNVL